MASLGNYINKNNDFEFEVFGDGIAVVTTWCDRQTYAERTLTKDELIELRDFLIEHTDPLS